MFWDKSYSQSQNIENLLKREDVTVEELLDDEDILQECKLQSRRLTQFLTRPDVIKRLITLIITEPPENLSIAERFKYSNTACEILTFGIPSLDEKLVEDSDILQTLYSFLENEPPLNPLLAAFFSKTFSMLISKKPEQDWFLYQKMCLQLLEFIKSRGNFLDLIFKHFATPVIMDLLLQIIKEVQGGTLKKNLYEWLMEQNLVERVIAILGNAEESEKHTNVAEFVIDLIKHGRSMRQSDQEECFELAFTGTDPLLQALEDEKTIALLLNAMLEGEPRESKIVAGILIVLTLVDESIVDEPASDKALKNMIDKEKENHERVVSTVIDVIAQRVHDFHHLLIEPPIKNNLETQSAQRFGLTRLDICRLFTVLLQTGNEKIINAICESEYFETLLKLFKQYSWNNFLHSEVEKCLGYVFASSDQNDNEKKIETNLPALQKHVIVNCKIISKLVDCWLYNSETQSSQNGRRLGYMGHLIQILKNVSLYISRFPHIGALIESTLNEEELASWKSLTDPQNGELSTELYKQTRLLADCDPKAFQNDNVLGDHDNNIEVNLSDGIDDQGKLYEFIQNDHVINIILKSLTPDEIAADLQQQLKVWGSNIPENLDDNLDLERFGIDATKSDSNTLSMAINPWGADPFTDPPTGGGADVSGWADFSSSNFADFDAHFNLFASDFGDKYDPSQGIRQGDDNELQTETDRKVFIEKSDSNANVEKISLENITEQQSELQTKNAKNIDLDTTEILNVTPLTLAGSGDCNTEPPATTVYNGDEEILLGGEQKTSCDAQETVPNEANDTVVSNGPTVLSSAQEHGLSSDEKPIISSNESLPINNSTNVEGTVTDIIKDTDNSPPPTTTTLASSAEAELENEATNAPSTKADDISSISENGPI